MDSGIPEYPIMLSVYGIPMFATSIWSTRKLNHVASVLAELLDQNEDGCADDQLILSSIIETRLLDMPVAVLLPTSEDDTDNGVRILENNGYFVATVVAENEAIPECSGMNFTYDCCDASLEELFHLITSIGASDAYPSIFQTEWFVRTYITDAMDLARGGHFRKVPTRYPSTAWYTYYDETCDYFCQGVEYTWWGYCAFSGVCEGRSGSAEYESEFKYLTQDRLLKGDSLLSELFLSSGNLYTIPTQPVDGIYKGCKTCPDGPDHGGI